MVSEREIYMIYTVTLNPSLDYYVKVDDFKEGIVNRTAYEKILPGGKGINVSLVLKNLGIRNTALGFVAGFVGKEIENRLKTIGISTDFINLKDGNSRINVKIKSDRETEINARGPRVKKSKIEDFYIKTDNLCDGDVIVFAGNIPQGIPETIYCDIMQRLSDRNIKVVVDAEKALLEKVLPYKPFLIKPNHYELGNFFGKELNGKEEIAFYAKQLHKMGAQNVFVSMAGKGGIFVSRQEKVFYAQPPKGEVVNSTGAGDSTVAGFLAEYSKSEDFEKAFVMGLCTGSASAFSDEMATREEVEKLYQKVRKIEYLK